jgi:hypothetical protein
MKSIAVDDGGHEESPVERDDADSLFTLDAWTLEEFDDLLHSIRRSAAYPVGDEMIAYPS